MPARDNLKHYFKNALRNTRSQLEVTQEEMAELMKISTRAYSDLESGKFFCSAYALINFVNNSAVDKDELFSDFDKIINNSEN